jgi:hypothetical protein
MRAVAVLVAAMAVQACSFIEAAGEISIGAEQKIPRVATELRWPSVDQLLTETLKTSPGSAGVPAGLPTSLGQATLAHVQGLMTIDGECHRSVLIPKVESQVADTQIKNLVFRVTNCGDPGRCVQQCAGFKGMKLEARIAFQLLDDTKAKKIKELLSDNTSPSAILQVRTRFSKLNYFELASDGKTKVPVGGLFSDSQLGLSSEGGGDETVIVDQRYLGKISPQTPQRFELDPRAPFTIQTKQQVIAAQTIWVEIFQRIWVPQENLYAITLGGGGVELDLQPEFVISALEVVKGAL